MAGFQPISAPPSAPPRQGLLAVVGGEAAELVLPAGWENGIAFEPERCGPPVDAAWGDCPEDGGVDPRTDPGTKDIGVGGAVVQYRPWMAWVGDACSVLGRAGRDPVARARRLYAASESRIVEQELWSGTEAQLRAYPNNYLRNAASPNFVNLSPAVGETSPGAYALGELQAAIAAGQTGRGMIHATWPVVNLWFFLGALRREGALILDVFDNLVVAGTGYDGSAPAGSAVALDSTGATSWAYATGIVQTKRHSDLRVVPDNLNEAIRIDTNDEEWRVERLVAAWWDGCVHAAINVNLCCVSCSAAAS